MRDDIYLAAYQNLYSNDGAMTKGIDNDTADGFGIDYVHDLINDLRNGTYRAKPVRRVYIPKKNGKMRPLGVPSFRDKLLQDAVRMYLEALYEPLFDDWSHGFRPKRSCHTAFLQIKKTFNGVPWVIEGDISKCFDDIDHDVLLEILSEKIKDNRFIQVIRDFLKAGYMDNWVFHDTYSGAAQGGIISPLLMNIYMNELDKKIRELGSEFSANNTGQGFTINKEYTSIQNRLKRLKMLIANSSGDQRKTLLKEKVALVKRRRSIPCKTMLDKRLYYVRYADDWLIGVHGSKQDCTMLKEEVSKFLTDRLHLTLSKEKTLITHSDQAIRFLGYDFWVSRSKELRRSARTGVVSRSLYKHVVLSAPLDDKIMPFLWNKKAIIQKENGSIVPRARTELLFARDDEIVRTYNSEIRGILNYYHLAGNYHKLSYFRYLMEYSCLYTLARKHNKPIKQIINMYKDKGSWSIPCKTKAGEKRIGIVKMAECKKPPKTDRIGEYFPYKKKELWKRIALNKCELCDLHSEVHCKVFTTRRLKDLGNEPWAVLMKAMRRKTLIVCPSCYNIIHSSHLFK